MFEQMGDMAKGAMDSAASTMQPEVRVLDLSLVLTRL